MATKHEHISISIMSGSYNVCFLYNTQQPLVPHKYFVISTEAFLTECTEVWYSSHCTVSQSARVSHKKLMK